MASGESGVRIACNNEYPWRTHWVRPGWGRKRKNATAIVAARSNHLIGCFCDRLRQSLLGWFRTWRISGKRIFKRKQQVTALRYHFGARLAAEARFSSLSPKFLR
jgi:hypothetical protein